MSQMRGQHSGHGHGNVFWAEISPSEHLVQLYQDEIGFLDALEGFVVSGLRKGDVVVVIATKPHRTALEKRLLNYGVNISASQLRDQYIALDAEESLSRFMVAEWPDETNFNQFVSELLNRARANGRTVRAFGEMVALLWERGQNGATVRLEHLWHNLCHRERFPLFCAYPRSGFTQDSAASIREICETHSRVVHQGV